MNRPNILLMRHAKSSWDDERLSDFERPLNDRGQRSCNTIASFLSDKDWRPNRIISSSSVRTRETVQRMFDAWGDEVPVVWLDELYLAAPLQIGKAMIENWSNDRTLYLGHNPGMQIFCSTLAAQSLDMPTAALCAFEWIAEQPPKKHGDLQPQNLRLVNYATPRSLEG